MRNQWHAITLAAQLRAGEDQAKGDPFALGTQLGASDASPHAFGLFITDALYQKYGGSNQFESFAQQQLNFALGANGWGSSAGNFAPFNTKTAAYEDNVVSWPSVEPADDYTANSLLAFALGGEIGSGLG